MVRPPGTSLCTGRSSGAAYRRCSTTCTVPQRGGATAAACGLVRDESVRPLAKPRQRMGLYRTVLHEGLREDLPRYLNRDVLLEL